MWNALRSDFKEFVSTVTEDTSQVLSKIDDSFPVLAAPKDGDEESQEGISPEEEEAQRRMQLEETFTTPLVLDEDADLYTEARKAELDEFVSAFEVTDELEQELESYPELHDMYRRLVPDAVPRRDFWMRYAYRCDADRIAADWDEQEGGGGANNEPAAAVSQSLSTVRQFLGGAVQSVAASLKEGDVEGSVTPDGAASSASAAGFFGVGGARPPFVLNTAVDEDDDDEEEEAEEELGWDDDEEDEDDEKQQDSTHEEIEFRDAATEQLQEQLKQALEERDQLHETVAMQAKEIADLLAQGGEGAGAATDGGADVEALKLKLFETESELAAVKARLLSSTSFEEPPSPEKQESIPGTAPDAELRQQAEELQTKLEQAELLCTELQGQVSELQGACSNLGAEKDALAAELVSLRSALEATEQDGSREAAEAREDAAKQRSAAEEAQAKLELAEQRILELERSLAEASRTASAASPETHESSASGVRVEAPASMERAAQALAASPATLPQETPPVVASQDGEEGSDWGDDW
jgi:hypothetical protein